MKRNLQTYKYGNSLTDISSSSKSTRLSSTKSLTESPLLSTQDELADQEVCWEDNSQPILGIVANELDVPDDTKVVSVGSLFNSENSMNEIFIPMGISNKHQTMNGDDKLLEFMRVLESKDQSSKHERIENTVTCDDNNSICSINTVEIPPINVTHDSIPKLIVNEQAPSIEFEFITDDVMAQLEELERMAMEKTKISTIKYEEISMAKVTSTKETLDELSMEALAALDAIESSFFNNRHVKTTSSADDTMIRCDRFVALLVTDNKLNRQKEISCYKTSDVDRLLDMKSNQILTVILSDSWYETEVCCGDIFHILFFNRLAFESNQVQWTDYLVNRVIRIDKSFGIFILHPDILISPTKIVESNTCARRGVISEHLKSFGNVASSAVIGNLKHSFIELLMETGFEALRTNKENFPHQRISLRNLFNEKLLDEMILRCISKNKDELIGISCDDATANEYLTATIEPVLDWIQRMFEDGIRFTLFDINENLKITSIQSCENNLWCPALGMKGQLDLSVEICIGQSDQKFVMPIELKTGKISPSVSNGHRAQVIIYILMSMISQPINLSVYQSRRFVKGLLLYVNAIPNQLNVALSRQKNQVLSEMISPSWEDAVALIQSRNSMALVMQLSSIISKTKPHNFPVLLKSTHDCEFCYQASECMLYHASLENGNKDTSGVNTLFNYALRGLSSKHLDFVRHWDHLIDLEASAVNSHLHAIWTIPSHIRERNSDKCIGSLVILDVREGLEKSAIVLKKLEGKDLLYNLQVGDRVFLSIERDTMSKPIVSTNKDIEDLFTYTDDISNELTTPFAIGSVDSNVVTGNIQMISDISLKCREIHVEVSSIPKKLIKLWNNHTKNKSLDNLIRLDHDNATIGISTMRVNIMSLFIKPHNPFEYKDLKHKLVMQENESDASIIYCNQAHSRLRELIVDLVSPRFARSFVAMNESKMEEMTSLSPQDHGILTTLSKDEMLDSLLMFCPKHIHPMIFLRSLLALNELCDNQYFDLLCDRRYFPMDMKEASRDSINAIRRGEDGEIYLFGGLLVRPGCNPLALYREYLLMNQGQREAIRKVLYTLDYSLLLGLPGTGKSSILSLIARVLICRGEKILLSSYTHTAIDNLLIKLKDCGVSSRVVMRLGNPSSVHSSVHDYLLSSHSSKIQDTIDRLKDTMLVACTVLAATKHPIVRLFQPSWSIIDEAGQISLPSVIGGLLHCHKFVLVGDDYQLPPLVISKEGEKLGMGKSLFKLLSEKHPHAVCPLVEQFRMNAEIMSLCNELVYENRMKCGNEVVATSKLVTSQPHLPGKIWLRRCLESETCVVFLNTDVKIRSLHLPKSDSSTLKPSNDEATSPDSFIPSISVVNQIEIDAIQCITLSMQQSGYDISNNMGIISPYSAQVKAIRECLKNNNEGNNVIYEVSTVDKFQGRDKDTIIFSTVRHCCDTNIGNLLRDWHRINVAITRAKKKLIVLGSKEVMQKIPILNGFIDIVQRNGWIEDL